MPYLSVDEFEDVQASMTLLLDALKSAEDDERYWKSAIIFAHAALQGACVCLLTHTDGAGALAVKNEKALFSKLYFEDENGRLIDNPDVPWPEEYIATLPELLRRLPKGLEVKLPSRNSSSYGSDKAGDLRRLHEFRNMFAHFPPIGWSLELIGLPRILRSAVQLIDEIAKCNAYKRWNKFLDNNDLDLLIAGCTCQLETLEHLLENCTTAPDRAPM